MEHYTRVFKAVLAYVITLHNNAVEHDLLCHAIDLARAY